MVGYSGGSLMQVWGSSPYDRQLHDLGPELGLLETRGAKILCGSLHKMTRKQSRVERSQLFIFLYSIGLNFELPSFFFVPNSLETDIQIQDVDIILVE